MSSPSLRITAALAVLLAMSPAAAADTGGSFRLLSAGPRDLALGGASSFGESGLEAIFGQPASMVLVDDWEGGIFLQRMSEDLPLQQGTLVLARGSGARQNYGRNPGAGSSAALGAAFQYMGATLADESGWGEWSLAGAMAWSPFRWAAFGLRGVMSRGGSEDGQDSGKAMAVAAGVRLRLLYPGLELGLFLDDLYHSFSWESGGEHSRDPAQVISLGWDGLSVPGLPGSLRLEGKATRRLSSLESYGIGGEWTLWEGAAVLRGGMLAWRLGEERVAPSFGFGLRRGALSFDYGFRHDPDSGAGSLHRLALCGRYPLR